MHIPSLLLPAIFALSTNALFECNENQKAFDPTAGKSVVHFTDARNSNYNDNEPWIRICKPNSSGGWDNVQPLGIPCSTAGAKTFSTGQTGLQADFKVGLGSSCGSGALRGAYFEYKSVFIDLAGDYSNGNEDLSGDFV
ncbi:hypothetical protein BJY04DRAFT_212615 [Aspergillus karnatakaensis]|uniref:uncharacterized protein n=1 Tax=Aspergillus karnatakaensis TaxID=1810916 RepID=UPI003CCD198E